MGSTSIEAVSRLYQAETGGRASSQIVLPFCATSTLTSFILDGEMSEGFDGATSVKGLIEVRCPVFVSYLCFMRSYLAQTRDTPFASVYEVSESHFTVCWSGRGSCPEIKTPLQGEVSQADETGGNDKQNEMYYLASGRSAHCLALHMLAQYLYVHVIWESRST